MLDAVRRWADDQSPGYEEMAVSVRRDGRVVNFILVTRTGASEVSPAAAGC